MKQKTVILDSDKLYSLFINEASAVSYAEMVADCLKNSKITLSIAESLTGGMVASKLVDIAGISEYFHEGIISYSNCSKIKRLGVKAETIEHYGAVSVQTAVEMAKGLIYENGANIAISTTGIAGPTGETLDKPIGLVYFGLATNNMFYCVKQKFSGSRLDIKEESANFALFFLLKYLKHELQ